MAWLIMNRVRAPRDPVGALRCLDRRRRPPPRRFLPNQNRPGFQVVRSPGVAVTASGLSWSAEAHL